MRAARNNSVANGKVGRKPVSKAIYVAASAGDAGGAIGAAYVAHHDANERNVTEQTVPLEPHFSNKQISNDRSVSRSLPLII